LNEVHARGAAPVGGGGHEPQDFGLNTDTAITPAVEPLPNPATPKQALIHGVIWQLTLPIGAQDGLAIYRLPHERMFGMKFFLYEIAARVVGIYLCIDCGRTLWSGFVERKIRSYHSQNDILDIFFDWTKRPVFHRDAAPARYWLEMGIQTLAMAAGFAVAIFGWFQAS
jgi:hypothetical protein